MPGRPGAGEVVSAGAVDGQLGPGDRDGDSEGDGVTAAVARGVAGAVTTLSEVLTDEGAVCPHAVIPSSAETSKWRSRGECIGRIIRSGVPPPDVAPG